MKRTLLFIIIACVLLTSACTRIRTVKDSSFNNDLQLALNQYDDIKLFKVTSGPRFVGIDIILNEDISKDEAFLKLIPILENTDLLEFVSKNNQKYGYPIVKISFIFDDVSFNYSNDLDSDAEPNYESWKYWSDNEFTIYLLTLSNENKSILIKKEPMVD